MVVCLRAVGKGGGKLGKGWDDAKRGGDERNFVDSPETVKSYLELCSKVR